MKLLCLLALLLVSTGVSAQTIKIGELNSYKVFPAFLEPYKKGMELALEEINASGGVLGRKLELVARDDGGNPGDAVRVAEELISREKVTVLMGTFAFSREISSSATRTASPGVPPSSRDTSSSLRPATPPAALISSSASCMPFLYGSRKAGNIL